MVVTDTLADAGVHLLAVGLLAWATTAALRSRDRPTARWFAALTGTLCLWGLASLATVFRPDSWVTFLVELAAVVTVPGLWVIYALGFTGRGTGLTTRRVLMLVGIAAPLVVAAGTVGVGVIEGLSTTNIELTVAGLLVTELNYLFLLFVYATVIVALLARNHPRVRRRHVAALAGGVAAPYLVGVAWPADLAVGGVPVGLAVSGLVLGVAARRYPVLSGFPRTRSVARSRVVAGLREAVVVLDQDGYVLDANAAASRALDRPVDALVGRQLRTAAPALAGLDLEIGARDTVFLRTSEGRRRFQSTVSAVSDLDPDRTPADSTPVARAVVLRDVTDRLTREQRLSVLHRVLRHNVRNKLDVILAYGDRIEDDPVRSAVRDSADRLLELSEKVREAERLLGATSEPPERVDVAAVAREVAAEYRTAHPDAEISVTASAPEDCRLRSYRSPIRQVLAELVENAVVHNDAETPHVEVRIEAEMETGRQGVSVAVADDGPGIPDRERRILTEGAETQLEHRQGVGLWLVSWAVLQLGGELAFRVNEPTGSVVTVTLPGQGQGQDREQDPDQERE